MPSSVACEQNHLPVLYILYTDAKSQIIRVRRGKINVQMSLHMYLASAVLRTLFQKILMVVKFTVHLISSSGSYMRFLLKNSTSFGAALLCYCLVLRYSHDFVMD